MRGLILVRDNGKQAALPLKNGESVFQRQVRILSACGIKKVIVVQNGDCEALQMQARCFDEADAEIQFINHANEAAALVSVKDILVEEASLILSGDLVFERKLISDILESTDSRIGTISTTAKPENDGMKAKIGLKTIQQIAADLTGVGCFASMPLYKLDQEAMALWLDAMEAQINAGNAALQAEMALHEIVSDLELAPFDSKEMIINRVSGAEDLEELFNKISCYEYTHQCWINESAGICKIPAWLQEHGCNKPFVVCESLDNDYHFADVLRLFALENVYFTEFDQQPTFDQAVNATHLFLQNDCDCVISLGGQGAHSIAKLVKMFAVLKQDQPYDQQALVYSDVFHVAVPSEFAPCGENNNFAVLNDSDKALWKHDCMLADIILYDDVPLRRMDQNERKLCVRRTLSQAIDIINKVDATSEAMGLATTAFSLLLKKGPDFMLQENRQLSNAASDIRAAQCKLSEAETYIAVQDLQENVPDNQTALALGADPLFNNLLGWQSVLAMLYKKCGIKEPKKFEKRLLSLSEIMVIQEAEYEASMEQETAASENVVSDQLEKKNEKKKSLKQIIISCVKQIPFLKTLYRKLQYELLYRIRNQSDGRTIVFYSYFGRSYNCNPRGVYEAMLRDPAYDGFRFVWALNNPKDYQFLKQNPNTYVVKTNSKAFYKECAKARCWISNVAFPAHMRPRKDQQYIHTWHGKLIKKIGCDVKITTARGRSAKESIRNFRRTSKRVTHLLCPSPAFEKEMKSAFDLVKLRREHILVPGGYARNDVLFAEDLDARALRLKLEMGIPLDKKVVLYAPTWRDKVYDPIKKSYEYQDAIDFKHLWEELHGECVLLFRAHNLEKNAHEISQYGDFVIDATGVEDINDLYIISDLMISDYSGAIYDYANLCRPMVFYMYDRHEYENESLGVYYDLDELPGKIVYTQEELTEAIKDQLHNFVYDQAYADFNAKYNGLDSAQCGAEIIHKYIDPEVGAEQTPEIIKRLRRFVKNSKTRRRVILRKFGLRMNANDRALLSFKDKHKGERCFLIGNGPSLRLEDLERISGEVSFSCNLIYKIFNRTLWRPTYHCITDNVFTKTVSEEIAQNITMPLFTNDANYPLMRKLSKTVIKIQRMMHDPYYVHGNIFEYYVPSAATVMTLMIELAIYMGFSEIYLIGVDCSNGFVSGGHFIKDYENADMQRIERERTIKLARNGKRLTFEELGKYRQDRSMFAYAKLRKYADKHGIKIYNATRGGYLEEFQRVNLDDLEFKGE